MRVEGKVVLVTGAAGGIGRALAERFHREGAAAVAVADLDESGVTALADEIGGLALRADVSREDEVRALISATEDQLGPIDLLCSNAGLACSDAPGWTAVSQPDEQWDRLWRVNVMAHVWAARDVLPRMIERGGGYFLNTVSAAGLLNLIGDAAYSTTKHAAIGFAESLVITHGDQGIKVSVLCPQAVRTGMFIGPEHQPAAAAASADGVLEPPEVAQAVIEGLAEERFLILPHPEVATYMKHQAADYDRWLEGMRRFRRTVFPDDGIMKWEESE